VQNICHVSPHGVYMLLGALETLRKAIINFVMFVCLPAWNNSTFTGRIFMIF